MINLLPPEIKNGYSYARSNVVLRKWVIIFIFGIIGLGAITTYGLLSIHQSSLKYTKLIAASDASFKKENYTLTQQRVQEISGSFKLAVDVLSKEVLFSKLIQQIGSAMPAHSVLTDLNISQTQGALDVTAHAADYVTATQVQVNLADPANQIFSKADIVNIACINDGESAPKTNTSVKTPEFFPCTVTIRALFAGNNSFQLINNDKVKKP